MAARYTKSIPEKIYFQNMGNGWFAGPFVRKPKNGTVITCKVEVEPTTESKVFNPLTYKLVNVGDKISIGTGISSLETEVLEIIKRYGQVFVRTTYGDFDINLVKKI